MKSYSLNKYNEVDFEFIYKSTLNRISFIKSRRNIIRPNMKFIVLFRNVIEPEFTKVYLHILMLWIMVGKFSKVAKIGHSLRRGVRYYRFMLKLDIIDNYRFYRFLEFLSYCLFEYIGARNHYFVSDQAGNVANASLILRNINGFTNLRFSDNFYLSGMPDDLFVNFIKKQNLDYFDSTTFFLSLFKLV